MVCSSKTSSFRVDKFGSVKTLNMGEESYGKHTSLYAILGFRGG